MLGTKLIVSGPIARLESDRIVVQRGDVTEIYSRDYYRLLPEVDDGPIQRAAVQARATDD